jgi:hypothetical protein
LPELLPENMTVEKQQRAQRLVLSRGADTSNFGEVREERRHFHLGKIARVPLPVKEDEAADPPHVGFFCPWAVVPQPDCLPYLIQ